MVDTLIKLFKSTSQEFSSNGIGVLSDATSCVVTEERNGGFELAMVYPVNGKYYEEISLRRILVAKSNPYSKPQAFRIYQIEKEINGTISVNAEHISYDLSGYPVQPFVASDKADIFSKLKSSCVIDHPFSFWCEGNSDIGFTVSTPKSTRNILGGEEGSILDAYGGEFEFDNYEVKLWEKRGTDRGVIIRYGKNLTDLQQEENCAEVYTGVYPYWYSESDEGSTLVELSGQKYIEAEGEYDFVRLYSLDLSSEFDEAPSEEDLRAAAEIFLKENQIGIPKVSLTLSFIELTRFSEYKNLALLEQVKLCDTVDVEFPEMQVSSKAKCISTTYNVLTDRYETIELGEAASNLATSLSETDKSIGKISRNTTSLIINQKNTGETIEEQIKELAIEIEKIWEVINKGD